MAIVSTLETATLVTILEPSDSISTGIENATYQSIVTGGDTIVTEAIGAPGARGEKGDKGDPGRDGADLAVTLPLTATGGAIKTISLNPATQTSAGSMSGADKVRLDNLLGLPTGGTSGQLLRRSSTGYDWITFGDGYGDNANASSVTVRKARGSSTTPTATQIGDAIGNFAMWGHDGTTFRRSAQLRSVQVEAPTSVSIPSRLELTVSSPTTQNNTVWMVDYNGNQSITGKLNAAGLLAAGSVDAKLLSTSVTAGRGWISITESPNLADSGALYFLDGTGTTRAQIVKNGGSPLSIGCADGATFNGPIFGGEANFGGNLTVGGNHIDASGGQALFIRRFGGDVTISGYGAGITRINGEKLITYGSAEIGTTLYAAHDGSRWSARFGPDFQGVKGPFYVGDGATGPGPLNFTVTNAGAMTATSATIAGNITAANLGTAASANTGNIGHVLPFTDVRNAWTQVQEFIGSAITVGDGVGHSTGIRQFGTSSVLSADSGEFIYDAQNGNYYFRHSSDNYRLLLKIAPGQTDVSTPLRVAGEMTTTSATISGAGSGVAMVNINTTDGAPTMMRFKVGGNTTGLIATDPGYPLIVRDANGQNRLLVGSGGTIIQQDTTGNVQLGNGAFQVSRFDGRGGQLNWDPSGTYLDCFNQLNIRSNSGATWAIVGSDSTTLRGGTINADRYADDASASMVFMRKARGTAAAPQPIAVGDALANFQGYGWNGSTFARAGNFRFAAPLGVISGGYVPGRLDILLTTDNGSNVNSYVFNNTGFLRCIGGVTLDHQTAAPSSPANGTVWTTAEGMFVRINGVTMKVTATAV